MRSPKIQVVIAAWNEAEGIGLTISELNESLDNPSIIVVDGKSTDETVEIARKLGAKIAFQDGSGKGNALAKGIKCLDPDTEYVVITDADHTYPAKYVPSMIEILEEDSHVGMVCGNRLTDDVDPKALHSVFHFGNKVIAFTHSVLNGIPLADPLTGLRVVRADILRNWVIKSQGFDIEVELNTLVEKKGFDTVEVPITYRERLGEKKLGVKHGAEIFKRIMLESMS